MAGFAALLLAGCGGGEPRASFRFDAATGRLSTEAAIGWHPWPHGASTRPVWDVDQARVDVPELKGSWALEVATGVPARKRAAFRVSGGGGEDPLFFEVVDGGEAGLWVARRIALPGPGTYTLEVLPPGAWARRFGRPAPEGASFSLPRLVPHPPGRGDDSRANLLLVSADTLRADRLGCYGAERPTSPAIDRLATEGVLFERAYAASNWTLPSHYSLLTGLDPSAHGVNPDLIVVGGYQQPAQRLNMAGSGRETTLAEALREAGYRTRAFTENGWVSARFGFHQGFDAYESDREGHIGRTRDQALAWLRENAERGPWFLFLHTYEVHQPYHAAEPYRSRFLDPGHVGYGLPGAAVPIHELNRFKVPSFPPTKGDVEAFRALYDGGVAYLDTMISDVRDALEDAGVERQTVVVFTSDHGEELFDRGGFDHIPTLYEEVAHVPLIVWAPGRVGPPPGTRLDGGPVSLTDLPNTLLGMMGVVTDEPVGTGRDLSRWLGAGAPGLFLPAGEPIFAESEGKSSEAVRAVWLRERNRLLKYVRTDARDGVREELFDLLSDPRERRDLSASAPAALARFRDLLSRREEENSAIRATLGVGEGATVDQEMLEVLRGLGYVQ